jgi:hypothetical protein
MQRGLDVRGAHGGSDKLHAGDWTGWIGLDSRQGAQGCVSKSE